MKVLSAVDLGNDILEVRGDTGMVDADGKPVIITTHGWVSALTNHYPPADFDAQGNHKNNTRARTMTPSERLQYCRNLLIASQPADVAPPVDLGIKDN